MNLSKPAGYKLKRKELLIKAEDLRQRLINDTRFEDSVIVRDLVWLANGKKKRVSKEKKETV